MRFETRIQMQTLCKHARLFGLQVDPSNARVQSDTLTDLLVDASLVSSQNCVKAC